MTILQPVPLQGARRALVVVLDEPALDPDFPHISKVMFTDGESAVIRGTRVKVSQIVGYLLMGETAQTIAEQVLPFLKLEQVLDAQRYYEAHREEIDEERRANSEEAGRKVLADKLGEDQYRKLTGGYKWKNPIRRSYFWTSRFGFILPRFYANKVLTSITLLKLAWVTHQTPSFYGCSKVA